MKNGHRQALTEIVIESIGGAGAKKAAPKAAAKDNASDDLSSKTVAELKEIAKSKGIEGISSMKKADLIAALQK